jgi:valyl-tRNA synthetase
MSPIFWLTNYFSVVGEQTGPVTGKPPPRLGETKEAISNTAQSSSIGQHASGKNAGSKVGTTEAADGEKKVKSEKERMDTS